MVLQNHIGIVDQKKKVHLVAVLELLIILFGDGFGPISIMSTYRYI